jgi:hypothetical protein
MKTYEVRESDSGYHSQQEAGIRNAKRRIRFSEALIAACLYIPSKSYKSLTDGNESFFALLEESTSDRSGCLVPVNPTGIYIRRYKQNEWFLV